MAAKRTLVDGHGRRVTTLRISLTDRCNFRCVYCMPPEGLSYLKKSDYLSTADVRRFASIAAGLGVTHFRLTGGEPLLRPDIVSVVSALRSIEGVDELSITTNGSMLDKLAAPLKSAGLDRINVSLDSLDPIRFKDVTRLDCYKKVHEGIEAAIGAGFPVKVNVVALQGMSDGEIIDFVKLAIRANMEVRFLEFMPLCGSGWGPEMVYPIGRVRDIVRRHFELLPQPRGAKPAETFAIAGHNASVGFIAPLTEPFCENCARIRISADGKIRPCLFSNYEVDVSALFQRGAADEEIEAAVLEAVANKPRGSQFDTTPFGGAELSVAGGPPIRSIGG